MADPYLPHSPNIQRYQLPAQPGDIISKWLSDNVTEELAGLKYLRTTGDHTGDIVLGELEARTYGWIDPNWVKIGAIGDKLKVSLNGESVGIKIDGYYNGATNADPDDVGLIVSTDGTVNGQIFRLTGSVVGGRNTLDVNVENTTAIPISGVVSVSNFTTLATAANQLISQTILSNILTEVTHLDDLDRNVGAVGVDTLRVHLSNESLAALENITVDISSSDLDIRDLTHVSDSIRLGDGTTLVNVNLTNELLVHDQASADLLSLLNGEDFATQATLNNLYTAFLAEDFATQTTLAALNAKVIKADTDNVTVVSSVLPTGAATETTLAALNTKVRVDDLDLSGSTDNWQGVHLRLPTIAGSVIAGTLANPIRVDTTGTTVQPVSVASLPLPAGAATEATLSSINGKDFATQTTLAALYSKFNTLGQKTSALSVPVVLPSDQTVPISAISLPLPTGAATQATVAAIQALLTTIDSDTSIMANWDTNVGAVGASTQRVHLSNESLAALENITVNIGSVDVDMRDLTHVSDSIRLGDGTTLTNVTVNNELKVHDTDALNALVAIRDSVQLIDNAVDGTELRVDVITSALPAGAATETTLNSLLTALNAEDFASETTLAAVLADTAIISGWDTNTGVVGANTQRVHLTDESLAALENITVTIDNIDVDIRDLSHTQDSIRLGDGTTLVDVTINNELEVRDADANTSLASIDADTTTIAGDTTSLDTKVPSQGAAITANSMPVNIASDQVVPVTSTDNPGNLIDSNNSSTTPLGIGATFTGTGTDISKYNTLTVMVHANQDSGVDGIKFQFSTDNTNWDDSLEFNLDASESDTRRFQLPVNAQYFRVVYVNGGVAQATFRLQTILHTSDIITTIHRVDDPVVGDRSTILTKSVIAGETSAGGGGFVNVKVNPSGSLEVEANQDTHDDLNANANIQVGDTDVSASNQVPVRDVLGSGGVYSNLAVGLAAVEVKVGASRLTNRKVITIFPVDDKMYWGFNNSVTITTGTTIFKDQLLTLNASDVTPIWIISPAAGRNARITESD